MCKYIQSIPLRCCCCYAWWISNLTDWWCRTLGMTLYATLCTLFLVSEHPLRSSFSQILPTKGISCQMIVKMSYETQEQWFDWKPMTKARTPKEKIQEATWQHKTATKTSITQQLRTNLGRSIWVTTATQQVWLNKFTGPHPPTNHKICVIKMTHI